MDQVPMFFEQTEDALGFVVSALGGAKQVGAALRPDLSPDAAARWLLDCLNPDRPAFLHPAQTLMLLRMAREVGIHNAMEWMCQATGYAKPVPAEPADEQAALMRQFIQAADAVRNLLPRLESLTVDYPAGMRVIK